MIYNESTHTKWVHFITGDGFYMKKILIVVLAAAMAAACSSNKSNVKTDGMLDPKYQIIDQEFDNLLAPETDYDTLPAYELQACGDTYLPPAKPKRKKIVKPAAKKVVKKTTEITETTENNKEVVNVTNVYEIDGPAPVPAGTVSTTQTTTYNSADSLPDTL